MVRIFLRLLDAGLKAYLPILVQYLPVTSPLQCFSTIFERFAVAYTTKASPHKKIGGLACDLKVNVNKNVVILNEVFYFFV
jgi:hypothetical protein